MSFVLQRRQFSIVDAFKRSRASVVNQLAQRRRLTIEQLEEERANRERVVVLGSGWAGYTLARKLNPKKYQAVIVSPRSYFVFTPLLASTSVGTLEFRTALEPVRTRRNRVAFFQGWADDVDFKNKTISIEEAVGDPRQGMSLAADRHENESATERQNEIARERKSGKMFNMSYDKLVVSVGCYSQTFGTPGVKENALFLKDVGDARKIRNRLLTCFESAALPTTSDQMKRNLLNFAIVGGGPTGIEFSAELYDLIHEDMARLYPELIDFYKITVYDVAPQVLSMFDEKLGKYAMEHFNREGIAIRTSQHIEYVRKGLPKHEQGQEEIKDDHSCYTLKTKEEGETGVGMIVWSTGLMMNPFVKNALGKVHPLPENRIKLQNVSKLDSGHVEWTVQKHPKTGGVITDDRLRVILQPTTEQQDGPRAVMQDVYALGDCAVLEGTMYPATAQVASQKAEWLAKRLNKADFDRSGFNYNNMGVMAYVGGWNAILQSKQGDMSGRTAFLIWRGAYLTKAVSWRNKMLIPLFWFVNWCFGRDVSRF